MYNRRGSETSRSKREVMVRAITLQYTQCNCAFLFSTVGQVEHGVRVSSEINVQEETLAVKVLVVK